MRRRPVDTGERPVRDHISGVFRFRAAVAPGLDTVRDHGRRPVDWPTIELLDMDRFEEELNHRGLEPGDLGIRLLR